MNALNTIKGLISKLKREEVKSLLKFLRYYQDSGDEPRGKGVQLIEAILSDPACTSRDLQFDLYGGENYHAFNKLLNRTKEKIYEVLLFDQNLSKPYYSERNRIIFETRKKLVQSEILYLRGMTEELESFQNKIISKAKEYEVYDSLIEALQGKQRFMVQRGGKKQVERIEQQIVFYEESRKKVQNARASFTRIGAKINQSTSPDDYLEELKAAIHDLEKDFKETNSATVGYYYYFLKTEWLQIQKDYGAAEIILKELLHLIVNHQSIYTKSRHGDVLLNLANNEILFNEFDDAARNASLAQDKFEFESVSYFVAREIEFYAVYYANDIELADQLITKICNSSRAIGTPFLISKWHYQNACMKTLLGKIEESNNLLMQVKEIEKDKEGWNIGKRILTIINRIEGNEFESADLKVLSLEKFIKRILKFRTVRKRDVIILRILLKLINDGFDFEHVYIQRKRYFDLLESNNPEYCWRAKSPELIVFHQWYRKKMESTSSKLKYRNKMK